MIIAYQTNQNKLVGLAKVHQSCERDGNLYLKPIETIGVKVRELKQADSKIAEIHAFKTREIKTVYDISLADAQYLLKIAGAKYKVFEKKSEKSAIASSVLEPPKRVSVEITRIVRDTAKTKELKKIYEYRCQICNQRIKISPTKFYAEVHHIKPLGGKHKGLDEESNMIVVCPTHHACFDLGVAKFVSSNKVKIGKEIFVLSNKHKLSKDNLDYHNKIIFGRNVERV